MKRTLTAVAAAVLMSMMALMFLGGLLKKAARVIDGLHNGSR
jgi:predicted aconitase with swiveling domain